MPPCHCLIPALPVVVAMVAYSVPVLGAPRPGWDRASREPEFGISGLALIEDKGETAQFLVVHDNKDDDEARLSV